MFLRFRHALSGLIVVLRRRELTLHVVAALFVTLFGILLCLDVVQWALVTLAIGFVLVAEIVNSAVEEIGNAVAPRRHQGIRLAKDISAAAVLISALTAAVIGFVVFVPQFLNGTGFPRVSEGHEWVETGSCLPWDFSAR